MEQFTVHLKNEKLPAYNRVGYLIFLLNVLLLGYISAAGSIHRWYVLAGSVGALLWLLLIWKQKVPVLPVQTQWLPGYGLLLLTWLLLQQYWIVLVLVLLALLDYWMRRSLVVTVSKEGVLFPSLPPRLILWEELDFVVLKDGLLTISLLNNKTIQAAVSDANQPAETAFNQFVQHLIQPPVS